MTKALSPGRPADRTRYIVRDVRERIIRGVMPPGSQLPTRAEMEETYGSGASTVQKALEALRQDGFVEVRGRQGTFVAERPPHLTDFAVVFPYAPGLDRPPSRFGRALMAAVDHTQKRHGVNLKIYQGVDRTCRNADFHRLVDDVQAHRLGGIIMASHPYPLFETPIFEEPGIPRVAIMGMEQFDTCSAVTPSMESFWTQAVRHLADCGCKRVAVIQPYGMEELLGKTAEDYLAGSGLTTEPEWMLAVSQEYASMAYRVARLLFSPGQVQRPDALVIADDNLVGPTLAGMASVGVNAPGDVRIVGHWNFPLPARLEMPCQLIGFDAHQILAACLDQVFGPTKMRNSSAVVRIEAIHGPPAE